MKRWTSVLAMAVCSLAFTQNTQAGEPNLAAMGLGSMQTMTHTQAKAVRGQTRRVVPLTTVTVFGSTFDSRSAGIGVIGGGFIGNGFIGGGAFGLTQSQATSGFQATGVSSATGWSVSQASLFNGSFASASAFAF
ncbi:MAG: hypothetical protein AB8B50_20625 [Pirellulaceae bacterium]